MTDSPRSVRPKDRAHVVVALAGLLACATMISGVMTPLPPSQIRVVLAAQTFVVFVTGMASFWRVMSRWRDAAMRPLVAARAYRVICTGIGAETALWGSFALYRLATSDDGRYAVSGSTLAAIVWVHLIVALGLPNAVAAWTGEAPAPPK